MYDYLTKDDEKAISEDLFGKDPDKTVYFEDQVVMDWAASNEAKKPIFVSKTYIRVKVHGREKPANMSYEARDHHKKKYPQQWQAYLDAKHQVKGMPTDVLLNFGIPPEEVATLKTQGALHLEEMDKVEGFERAKTIAAQLLETKRVENLGRPDERAPSGELPRTGREHQDPEDVHPHGPGRQPESIRTDSEGTEYTFSVSGWG